MNYRKRWIIASHMSLGIASACLILACSGEPRLNGESRYWLHMSSADLKKELSLSPGQANAMEAAIDVLVGEDTRRLLDDGEAAEGAEGNAREQEALAPIDGLSFGELLDEAAGIKQAELYHLRQELSKEEIKIAEHREDLEGIEVVRARYQMGAGRRSWIDVTVRNRTEEHLDEILLDCRLVEAGRSEPWQKGTCPIVIPGGLAPGLTTTARSIVGWDTGPRRQRLVEMWPIRAYGKGRALLWDVPSELNPLEAGRIAKLETEAEVVARVLSALQLAMPAEA